MTSPFELVDAVCSLRPPPAPHPAALPIVLHPGSQESHNSCSQTLKSGLKGEARDSRGPGIHPEWCYIREEIVRWHFALNRSVHPHAPVGINILSLNVFSRPAIVGTKIPGSLCQASSSDSYKEDGWKRSGANSRCLRGKDRREVVYAGSPAVEGTGSVKRVTSREDEQRVHGVDAVERNGGLVEQFSSIMMSGS